MADDIKKQIADAEKAAAEADKLLQSMLKLFKMDGKIDKAEKESLSSAMKTLEAFKAHIAALKAG